MIRWKASVVTQKPAGTRMPSIRESSPRCAPLPPTTATCVWSISSKTQHVALDHRDTSKVAVLRRTAMAGRACGMTDSAEPPLWHALISFLPPPPQSYAGNSTRTLRSPIP